MAIVGSVTIDGSHLVISKSCSKLKRSSYLVIFLTWEQPQPANLAWVIIDLASVPLFEVIQKGLLHLREYLWDWVEPFFLQMLTKSHLPDSIPGVILMHVSYFCHTSLHFRIYFPRYPTHRHRSNSIQSLVK